MSECESQIDEAGELSAFWDTLNNNPSYNKYAFREVWTPHYFVDYCMGLGCMNEINQG